MEELWDEGDRQSLMVLGDKRVEVRVGGCSLVYLLLDRPPQAPALPYSPSDQASRRGDEACRKRDGDGKVRTGQG